MLWASLTLIAALLQVLRNAAQASLTGRIGTLGATQVRFVFGLPFALVILGAAALVNGHGLPPIPVPALGWAVLGALIQALATGLMLAVMQRRAFSAAYAYIKTEPVLVALFGAVLLGDVLPALGWAAVATVTVGVLLASSPQGLRGLAGERRAIAMGVGAGALFGLSSVAFRAAITGIGSGPFWLRSFEVLALTLAIQTLVLGLWLGLRDRSSFVRSLREWRRSIGAGALGAFASAFWFCAFALTAAANVRTLGLVEMPLAALLSGKLTGQGTARHEWIGLTVVLVGLLLLLVVAG